MPLKTVLFDLDGTLTDSAPGITNAIAYALREHGMAVPPREALYRFIGPPLVPSFQEAYGLDEPAARRLLETFRVYFCNRGIWENRVYDGVPEMLAVLRDRGCRLLLATGKPEHNAVEILERFGLISFFSEVCGSTPDERNGSKDLVIAEALRRSGAEADGAVMVGDRSHDVLGAHDNGLPVLGVLYGYGTRAELTEAGADRLCPSVSEIPQRLQGLV